MLHRDLANGLEFRFMVQDSHLAIVTTKSISSPRKIVLIFIDTLIQ